MFSTNYYTLVAGLRQYTPDGENKGFDLHAILAEVDESLAAADRPAVQLLYTLYDCENLVRLHDERGVLRPRTALDRIAAFDRRGLLTPDELLAQAQNPSGRLPERVERVLRAYRDPEGEDAAELDMSRTFAAAVFDAYYRTCAQSSSRFLRRWSDFDRTLRNIVAASVARAAEGDVASATVGDDDITAQLQRSSAADFGLRGELAFADEAIAAAVDEHNPLKKGRRLDDLRWAMADELSESDYFDINAVLAYLVRMNIVARWTAMLDIRRRTGATRGEGIFNILLGKLDRSVAVQVDAASKRAKEK